MGEEAALTPPTQTQVTAPLSGHKRPTPRVRRLSLPEDDETDSSADVQEADGARKRLAPALDDDDDDECTFVSERTREERTAQGISEAINLLSSEDEDAGNEDEESDEVDGVCPVCECAWGGQRDLVGCDCGRWAHLHCAGFRSVRQAERASYQCPVCTAALAPGAAGRGKAAAAARRRSGVSESGSEAEAEEEEASSGSSGSEAEAEGTGRPRRATRAAAAAASAAAASGLRRPQRATRATRGTRGRRGRRAGAAAEEESEEGEEDSEEDSEEENGEDEDEYEGSASSAEEDSSSSVEGEEEEEEEQSEEEEEEAGEEGEEEEVPRGFMVCYACKANGEPNYIKSRDSFSAEAPTPARHPGGSASVPENGRGRISLRNPHGSLRLAAWRPDPFRIQASPRRDPERRPQTLAHPQR